MNKLIKSTDQNISRAAKIIQSGGLVVFPTETVYGLGENVFNENAVIKIFNAKQRPRFDPLIVHIAEKKQLNDICYYNNKQITKLINAFWPGPLTIIFPKKKSIPDIVTAGLQTVAVRMPAHPVAKKLIKQSKCPIAAPSANKFSYITPTSAQTVYEQLSGKVDLILDDGQSNIGIESTVISLIDKPVILRPGGLDKEKIEKIIGEIGIDKINSKLKSPGQLKKHYAPDTKIEFLLKNTKINKNKKNGLIVFSNLPENRTLFSHIEVLSPSGDLNEAARNLFSILYKLDKMKLAKIYVEKVPEKDIGIAIMDRLKKAVN